MYIKGMEVTNMNKWIDKRQAKKVTVRLEALNIRIGWMRCVGTPSEVYWRAVEKDAELARYGNTAYPSGSPECKAILYRSDQIAGAVYDA